MRWWPEPTAADIVWCHFPDNIHPRPKPRPGLIVSTKEDDEGKIFISVAYGTSQKTNRLCSGEFRITKDEHPAAYASADLSYDAKFDLRNVLELPFNSICFSDPPHAPPRTKPEAREPSPEHGPDCERGVWSDQEMASPGLASAARTGEKAQNENGTERVRSE